MIQRETEADELYRRCRSAADQVLHRYQWRLVGADALVPHMVECIQSGQVADPTHAVIYVYGQVLFTACRGGERSERQEQAFTELYRYLYELSFREQDNMPADLRLGVVNEALLRIWERLPSYHKPEAFLAAAAMELRSSLHPWWWRSHPASRQHTSSLEAPARLQDFGGTPDAELVQRVRACFDEVLYHTPDARQQLEAVWLKYMGNLDDETIGAYLQKPVASVHTLHSHGLTRLRAEPIWQLLARDLGLKG